MYLFNLIHNLTDVFFIHFVVRHDLVKKLHETYHFRILFRFRLCSVFFFSVFLTVRFFFRLRIFKLLFQKGLQAV